MIKIDALRLDEKTFALFVNGHDIGHAKSQCDAEFHMHFLRETLDKELVRAEAQERERCAQVCDSWGDQCAGGSGGEIIPSGPSQGQRYGEGYYNLATSIRKG